MDICVLLQNGEIKVFNKSKDTHQDDFQADLSVVLNVGGQVVSMSTDRDDNQWAFIVAKNSDDEMKLFAMHKRKLHDITSQVPEELDDDFNIVVMFAPGEITQFIIQKNDKLIECEIDLEEDQPSIKVLWQKEDIEELQEKIHSAVRTSTKGLLVVDNYNFYGIET